MKTIVTPERVRLHTLQAMREEFGQEGDQVGYYAIDYLIANYLDLDGLRDSYVQRLKRWCERDIAARAAPVPAPSDEQVA